MAKNKKQISVRFAVVRDPYGRRVFSPEFLAPLRFGRSRGLQDSQKALRTNEALLGVIARGGDVAPTVSNPENYFDPGHKLDGVSDDDLLRSAVNLPEHRLATRPERLFSPDAHRTRDFVDGVVSEVGEALAVVKAKRSSGSDSGDSGGSSGQS